MPSKTCRCVVSCKDLQCVQHVMHTFPLVQRCTSLSPRWDIKGASDCCCMHCSFTGLGSYRSCNHYIAPTFFLFLINWINFVTTLWTPHILSLWLCSDGNGRFRKRPLKDIMHPYIKLFFRGIIWFPHLFIVTAMYYTSSQHSIISGA